MKYEEQKLSELVDTISDTRKIDKDKVVLVNTSDVLAGEVLNHTYTENCNLRGQFKKRFKTDDILYSCLLYTSPSPRDATLSRMPSSA